MFVVRLLGEPTESPPRLGQPGLNSRRSGRDRHLPSPSPPPLLTPLPFHLRPRRHPCGNGPSAQDPAATKSDAASATGAPTSSSGSPNRPTTPQSAPEPRASQPGVRRKSAESPQAFDDSRPRWLDWPTTADIPQDRSSWAITRSARPGDPAARSSCRGRRTRTVRRPLPAPTTSRPATAPAR